jgi:CBS-domain-containing membrane protein
MKRRIAQRMVREVMSASAKTVGPKTSVRALQGLFVSHDFNAFPVVDETGVLLGIVSKLDLLRMFRHDPVRLRPDLGALWAEHVDDVMRRRVVTLGPRDGCPIPSASCMRRGWRRDWA